MTPHDPATPTDAIPPSTAAGPLRVAAPPMIAVTLLLLVVASRYGPHWDELYFAMLPLQWWYVDQPPLTVWLTWAAAQVSDALWVQRLPAIAAAAAGAYVAGLFPRALGASVATQRLAAWAHAFTVYPLIMGHIFTTSAIDLLAWQVILLLVLRATLGHTRSLVWAGLVAGLACWNKLLVVVLVAAVLVALVVTDRWLLRTRAAVAGASLFLVLGAPQVLAQLVHGLPMAQVSAALAAEQGSVVRLVLLPALALFAGPPLLLVWLHGLVDPWRSPGQPGRFVLPTLLLLIAWTLASPSQPYYAMGVLLPALAMGWASQRVRERWRPGKRRGIVAVNGAVAALLCLPLLPAADPWLAWLSRANPTIRDQVGWPDYAHQISEARREGEAIVVDSYALAGALHRFGPEQQQDAVYSGHNGLWDLGPPRHDRVLLAGEHAVAQQASFTSCEPAGELRTRAVVHPHLAHVPMVRCEGPIEAWDALWPRFRRLGG